MIKGLRQNVVYIVYIHEGWSIGLQNMFVQIILQDNMKCNLPFMLTDSI